MKENDMKMTMTKENDVMCHVSMKSNGGEIMAINK